MNTTQVITEYLYKYIQGSSTDYPSDEYLPEAKRLSVYIEANPNYSSDDLAQALSDIFTDMFGDDYSKEGFVKAGSELAVLLRQST